MLIASSDIVLSIRLHLDALNYLLVNHVSPNARDLQVSQDGLEPIQAFQHVYILM